MAGHCYGGVTIHLIKIVHSQVEELRKAMHRTMRILGALLEICTPKLSNQKNTRKWHAQATNLPRQQRQWKLVLNKKGLTRSFEDEGLFR
jgi:hypothetical protein